MGAINASAGSTPVADNSKAVGANVVAIAAGAGVTQVVTPVVPQQAATVRNLSNNWVRVAWNPNAGVTVGGAAANRVSLIPPSETLAVDFSDSEGDNSVNAVDPILSASVVAVLAPTVTSEAGTLGAATAATAGLVVINWITC